MINIKKTRDGHGWRNYSLKVSLLPKKAWGWVQLAVRTGTAMIGYHIHGSVGWGIMDWIFYPVVWIKWLIYNEVSATIIKETFEFLVK